MSKFTYDERNLVKSIVASLTIKRIPEPEIIKAIFDQTQKTITGRQVTRLRRSIKKESYPWYKTMREGEYEYIHEFKERINEILNLQKRHHEIIDSPMEPTTVKQTSLAELHRLNITLSNYFDVAPDIINGSTLSETPKAKAVRTTNRNDIIVYLSVLRGLPFWIWDPQQHTREHIRTNGSVALTTSAGISFSLI